MKNVMLWRGVFVLCLLLVTWLTLTPNPDDTESGMAITRWFARMLFGDEALSDKLAHFGAYGLLGVLALPARVNLLNQKWAAPALLAVYGVLLEGVQGLGGVRTPELADAVANAGGAGAGFVAAWLALRWRRQKQNPA